MSIDKCMDKKKWYAYRMEYYTATRRGNPAICDNIGGPWGNYFKGNKGQKDILFDCICGI